MAAKFTAGDSIKTTRNTISDHRPPEPKTHSVAGARRGNTMNGMPGYIDADQSGSMGGAKGGKGVGPHREAYIGQRGGSGAESLAKAAKATGTVVKNYKSASTGKAGPVKSNSHDGTHHIHTANRSHGMPGQKAPPTSRGAIGGGHMKSAGIDLAHAKQQRGKMEKLAGRAITTSEGRRKSNMY